MTRNEKPMVFLLCFLSFFIIRYTLKKGGECDGWTIIGRLENQLHNFLFVSFFHYSNLLLEKEELGIIDDCRILGRQLNYNL